MQKQGVGLAFPPRPETVLCGVAFLDPQMSLAK